MFLLKAFECIILILIVMFAAIFTIVGVAMTITKDAINNMKEFNGDKKDEQ